MKRKIVNKRGQVWVETVIYTLIAFTMIGLVLTYAKPEIEKIQDKAIIEQSISMVKEINLIILDIKRVAGNQRLIELGIKKGVLKIDGKNDKIIFEIESRYEYSEPGEDINETTGIIARTEKKGKFSTVTLTKDYSREHNITYQGEDKLKTISKSSTPYKLFISNEGGNKFEGETCEADEDCDSKEGFTVKCLGEEGFKVCEYVAEKTTINIEIV